MMKRNYSLLLIFFLSLVTCGLSQTTNLVLPASLEANDTPNDSGKTILLVWPISPTESKEIKYTISTSSNPDGSFGLMDEFVSTGHLQSDKPIYFWFYENNKNRHYYEVTYPTNSVTHQFIPTYFKLGMKQDTTMFELGQVVTATPKQNFFKMNKINNFMMVVFFFAFTYYFIRRAQKDPNLFIRRIPGLEALDDAIGRATEMGKPILYLTGAYDMDQVSTIASVNILSHVAKKVASYDSRIIVPSRFSITMTVCQETVREAYMNVGRPDAYNQNDIYYVTEDQFGYTAAVDGIMAREKPAANFLLGTFAGEAIILAETGALNGAIQISGTDSTYQLPFFMVACDYTLIGEELYAASAYLSREPKLLGTLRGQDAGKVILVLSILIGAILLTVQVFEPIRILSIVKWIYTAM